MNEIYEILNDMFQEVPESVRYWSTITDYTMNEDEDVSKWTLQDTESGEGKSYKIDFSAFYEAWKQMHLKAVDEDLPNYQQRIVMAVMSQDYDAEIVDMLVQHTLFNTLVYG